TNWFFGQDPSQMTATQTDFLTVAEHEMGHVLGIGTSDQWFNQISNQTFTGPASKAVFGGNVPLDSVLGHWAQGTRSDGRPATMNPILLNGTRDLFTSLDFAALKDVGWSLQSPQLQFSQSTYSAAENAGNATITVTRSGGLGPVTVHYATGGGTAVPG